MLPVSLQLRRRNCVFAAPIFATGLFSDLCPISKHKTRQRQERPLHSQADKALGYPGIWTSEAAPETPTQEQAASTLLKSSLYLITSNTCPKCSSRSCYSCPDCQQPGQPEGKHPRKQEKEMEESLLPQCSTSKQAECLQILRKSV